MSKKESSFANMLLTLFVVTAVAALALGGVYTVTKEPIELAKKAKLQSALRVVLPEFDTIDVVKILPPDARDSITFFRGYKDNQWVGSAVRTFSDNGYGGRIWIMAGIMPDHTVMNTAVLEARETPGLGDKLSQSKSDWSLQFNGKNLKEFNLYVKKDKGEVDAITAATISSRAFCEALRLGYQEFSKMAGEDEMKTTNENQ